MNLVHVIWLRFRADGLAVDSRQVVSLFCVHGRGSLFNVNSLIHFSVMPV